MISLEKLFDRYTEKHPFLSLLYYSLIISFVIIFCFSMYQHFFDSNSESTIFNYFLSFVYFSVILYVIFLIFQIKDYSHVISTSRKLRLDIGLRRIYRMKKRLPMFICKHCFKTIIVKNLNITCPFCNAQFLMTDNETQKQLGDVKIKGYRNLVDESTMEKVLFDKCPVCSGMIQFVDCYHCNEELNFFEDYDKDSLERNRYEI